MKWINESSPHWNMVMQKKTFNFIFAIPDWSVTAFRVLIEEKVCCRQKSCTCAIIIIEDRNSLTNIKNNVGDNWFLRNPRKIVSSIQSLTTVSMILGRIYITEIRPQLVRIRLVPILWKLLKVETRDWTSCLKKQFSICFNRIRFLIGKYPFFSYCLSTLNGWRGKSLSAFGNNWVNFQPDQPRRSLDITKHNWLTIPREEIDFNIYTHPRYNFLFCFG